MTFDAALQMIEGRAASRHARSAVLLVIGAVLLLLATGGTRTPHMAGDPQVRFIVLLFAGGALLLVGLALHAAVKRLRFGVTRLRLDEPPVLGGSLSGRLILPSALERASALSLTLECERKQTRLSWFGLRADVTVDSLKLWREVQKLDPALLGPAPRGNRVTLPVSFAIPSETRLAVAAVDRMQWCLRVSASEPRFEDDFAVPVGRRTQ